MTFGKDHVRMRVNTHAYPQLRTRIQLHTNGLVRFSIRGEIVVEFYSRTKL